MLYSLATLSTLPSAAQGRVSSSGAWLSISGVLALRSIIVFSRSTESATAIGRKYGIQDFLCLNIDTHVWSPPGPGKHGFMYVGLGKDQDLFATSERRHLFVGKGKYFQYCGHYEVLRVQPLAKNEWTTLPMKVCHSHELWVWATERQHWFAGQRDVDADDLTERSIRHAYPHAASACAVYFRRASHALHPTGMHRLQCRVVPRSVRRKCAPLRIPHPTQPWRRG